MSLSIEASFVMLILLDPGASALWFFSATGAGVTVLPPEPQKTLNPYVTLKRGSRSPLSSF